MTASKTKRLLYFMSELEKGNDISKRTIWLALALASVHLKRMLANLRTICQSYVLIWK